MTEAKPTEPEPEPTDLVSIERAAAAIADLPGALHLAAFEQLPGGVFQPIGRLPAWLAAPDAQSVDLCDIFPMLEMFLPDWETVWQGISDIWTEHDAEGREQYLQAVATEVDGRRFLVLKTLPEALYTYQQMAHDFELAKERVERLSRELEIKRQEAERATQAKSEFLARMSHEIRTPLNAVIGMADVLSSSTLTAEQRRCVEVSQRNGIGLLNLINDILDLAKVESGKVELENTELNLRDVIARAMEVVEARAAAKGLTLRATLAPAVPVALRGDPNRLRQILINLLGNSIKFTDKGSLTVHVEPDTGESGESIPGRLRFGVSDTGIGIAPDKVHTVFESFSQADTSTTRKYGGTGLGLTISKQLTELMGGRIWVESTLGVGSTFFFTACLGVQEIQPDAPAGNETAHAAAPVTLEALEACAKGMKILLADDSEDNRFLILSYLKRTESSVDIAENGAIAAELFRDGTYDVILMDVEMPVMDGYMATRAIREQERASGAAATPVLALTAHAFADMAVKGFEAGFTELLTKPIRNVTLLEAIGKYPRRQHLARPAAPVVLKAAVLPEPVRIVPEAAPAQATGKPGAIRIQVEEGMEDVVPGYLERRKSEVAVYRDALAKGDLEAIRGMAHRMKGTGSGYGLPTLTELGGAIEQAAKQSDTVVIQTKLEALAQYLDKVELEYK